MTAQKSSRHQTSLDDYMSRSKPPVNPLYLTKPGSNSPDTHTHTCFWLYVAQSLTEEWSPSCRYSCITSCEHLGRLKGRQQPVDLLLFRIMPAVRFCPENAHLSIWCQHTENRVSDAVLHKTPDLSLVFLPFCCPLLWFDLYLWLLCTFRWSSVGSTWKPG